MVDIKLKVIMSIDEADSVGTRGYASITKSYNERE